jgi:hypothetical protein
MSLESSRGRIHRRFTRESRSVLAPRVLENGRIREVNSYYDSVTNRAALDS